MTAKPRSTHVVSRDAYLYLAIIEAWLRSARISSERVRMACSALDGAIRRDRRLVAGGLSGITEEQASAWHARMVAEVTALGEIGPSAVVWAAVDAWNDAGHAPWTRYAEAASRLGRALDGRSDGEASAQAALASARAAAKLRECAP